MRRIAALALLACVLPLGASCGPGDAGPADGRPTLTVGAAADLRAFLESARPRIEEAAGVRLTLVFGSSGQLKQQIVSGAAIDLFLSADADYVAELERDGRTTFTAEYATGRLALMWREGIDPLTGVEDLGRADIRRISIAQPAHAPYGRAAKEALTTVALWDQLQPRLVFAENVRQAVDYVSGGNADAGLVALSLVTKGTSPYVVVPAFLHRPIRQAGAVIKGGQDEAAARRILDYLLSAAGQSELQEFGYEKAGSQ